MKNLSNKDIVAIFHDVKAIAASAGTIVSSIRDLVIFLGSRR